MNVLPYVLISLLGGAIVPLQLAIVNAFRQSTHASQIQATLYFISEVQLLLLSCRISLVEA